MDLRRLLGKKVAQYFPEIVLISCLCQARSGRTSERKSLVPEGVEGRGRGEVGSGDDRPHRRGGEDENILSMVDTRQKTCPLLSITTGVTRLDSLREASATLLWQLGSHLYEELISFIPLKERKGVLMTFENNVIA